MLANYCVAGFHMKRCATKKCKNKEQKMRTFLYSAYLMSYQLLKYVGSTIAKEIRFKISRKMLQVNFGFGDTAVDEAK